jgi:deazaflavin-dependent oxidoreductase (nitroreductase family)
MGWDEQNEWNSKVIEEFRANDGQVGGNFAGAPMILVHHEGRVSGKERVTPLMYQPVDGGYAIFASKAGATTDPDWYHNLLEHPDTTIEVGKDTIPVTARDTKGAERDGIWEKQKAASPGFAEYEKTAAPRVIPVVVLEPRS